MAKSVKKEADKEQEDEFDDIFGVDEDKKKARERIKKLVEEEKEKAQKEPEEDPEEKKEENWEEDDEKENSEKADNKEEDDSEDDKSDDEDEDKNEEPKPVKEKPKKKRKKKKEIKEEEPKEAEEVEPEPEEIEEGSVKEKKGPKVEVVEPVPQKVLPELRFLQDGDSTVLIGRKKSVHEKFGMRGALQVGRVTEDAFKDRDVFLDSLNPHVVFVCGARGSGKSYALGVIAEELALKNPNVGVMVIDPVGVFWSMKFPNREEKELESLKKWGLKPVGLDNLMVFIPQGMAKDTPRETYDATFSIRPSLLTATDWCLTFGIEKFSPTGLLLEQAIEKVKKGFTTEKEKIRGKGKDYSIDDVVFTLESDVELNSRDKGFKADSIRAITSRFISAKTWGIFDINGTPLTELSRENQLTIIDTSFLDDSVTALVIGILARRVLAARKISTRKEAAKRMDVEKNEEMLEFEIPPTWIFIDEAHTLIPSGNVKTPATEGLIEYVKQGRRPGCSLVFATQQPSAIDTRVLSQLDVIMTHKLVFNDDVKAVYKRTPTIIPHKYKAGAFIKTLPVGTAMVGDRREETSRAFMMKIRPRMSQHEGREAETIEVTKKLDGSAVLKLLFGMYWNRLRRDGSFKIKELARIVKSMNKKYESSVELEEVLSELKGRGAIIDEKSGVVMLNPVKKESVEKSLMTKGEKAASTDEDIEEEEDDEDEEDDSEEDDDEVDVDDYGGEEDEGMSLLAFPAKISEDKAISVIRKKKLGGLLGFLKRDQRLIDTRMKHISVFRVEFNYFNEKNAFRQGTLFVNSLSGEFLHFKNGKFVESNGLKDLYDLKEDDIKVLNILSAPKTLKEISKKIYFDEEKIKKIITKLGETGLLKKVKKKEKILFQLKKGIEVPATPLHPIHNSLKALPVVETEVLLKETERYSKKDVSALLRKIWKKLVVKNIDEIYWPVFEGTIQSGTGKKHRVLIDAVTGKVLAH